MGKTNFTRDIKRELLSKRYRERAEKVASLSAFLRTSGGISYTQDGLGFFLVTETERIGEHFLQLLEDLYDIPCSVNAAEERLRGRQKLTVSYNGEKAIDILIDLGIIDRKGPGEEYGLSAAVPWRLLPSEGTRLSYIRGAFLGSGSCTLPREGAKTGYHLEFVFAAGETAEAFTELLSGFQLIMRVTRRKESSVVYSASVAAISDFLAVVGATTALKRLSSTAEEREGKNNFNRVNNCFVGNMDRTATASAKQCLAIERLERECILASLDGELRVVAAARMADREASLGELAAKLGISKSCLAHRMRRLTDLSAELAEEGNGKKENEKKGNEKEGE